MFFNHKHVSIKDTNFLCPQRQLATSKGCIAGDLQFVDKDGKLVDCDSHAVSTFMK